MAPNPAPGGPRRTGPSIIQLLDRLAFKITGALNVLFGMQWAAEREGIEYYAYQKTITTGTNDAANTTYSDSLRISSDADFICTRIAANARNDSTVTAAADRGKMIGVGTTNGTGGDLPDAPFTLLLTDGGGDKQLSNEAVDAALAFGTWGSLLGFMPKARWFRRNSNLGIRLTSLKLVPAATAWVYKILFVGFKVYDANPYALMK